MRSEKLLLMSSLTGILLILCVLLCDVAYPLLLTPKRYAKVRSSELRMVASTDSPSSSSSEYEDESFGSSISAADSSPGSSMEQLQISFDCDEISPETVTEFLFELGVFSVSVEYETEKNVLNEEKTWSELGKTSSWQTALIKAHFAASYDKEELLNLLQITFKDVKFQIGNVETLENKDWVSEVQQSWKPCRISNDITIKFPWHVDEVTDTPMELVLEGGAAFGTGDHPTTRLCVDWLANLDLKDKTLIDYGCGSGILGLIALKYDAKEATGTDIDKDALISAKKNCEMNGLQMDLYLADDVSEIDAVNVVRMNNLKGGAYKKEEFLSVAYIENRQYEIVVANILAPILISLKQTLANHTKKGGLIALSGLITEQSQSVIEAFQTDFEDLCVAAQSDGWCLITGRKQ